MPFSVYGIHWGVREFTQLLHAIEKCEVSSPVREVSTPFYAHLALNALNALVHLQFNFRKKIVSESERFTIRKWIFGK